MIADFADNSTADLFAQGSHKRWTSIQKGALRRLYQLHAANELWDLRAPPGNRLEALTGDRAGQHSIRINDQFRVCFRWHDGNAHDVEIVDYH